MAHAEQRYFIRLIKKAFPQFFVGSRVIDIGSLDVNGSAHEYFENARYIGVDLVSGSGVDIVCAGEDYDAPDGCADVVLSCEAMEHNLRWARTFKNMIRLSRPGGLVMMTCATSGRAEHGTMKSEGATNASGTWITNYYGNLEPDDFRRAIDLQAHLSKWMFCTNASCWDLYFAGFRNGSPPPDNAGRAFAMIKMRYLAIDFLRSSERRLRKTVRR